MCEVDGEADVERTMGCGEAYHMDEDGEETDEVDIPTLPTPRCAPFSQAYCSQADAGDLRGQGRADLFQDFSQSVPGNAEDRSTDKRDAPGRPKLRIERMGCGNGYRILRRDSHATDAFATRRSLSEEEAETTDEFAASVEQEQEHGGKRELQAAGYRQGVAGGLTKEETRENKEGSHYDPDEEIFFSVSGPATIRFTFVDINN